jgi:hypothetical protein
MLRSTFARRFSGEVGRIHQVRGPKRSFFDHFVTTCYHFNKTTGNRFLAFLREKDLILSLFLPLFPHFKPILCHF